MRRVIQKISGKRSGGDQARDRDDAENKCAAIERRALAAKFFAANLHRLLPAQIARLVLVDGVRRGTSRRLRLRSRGMAFTVPHNYLVFEFDVERLVHALSDVPDQGRAYLSPTPCPR